jgi:hypothetical protein
MKNSNLENIYQKIQKDYISALPNYQNELESINTIEYRLFPDNFILDKEKTEIYRSLCLLSQSSLKTTTIKSHRKYVGKFIVLGKKIIWKILESQLKNSFVGVQACFSRLIINQARLETEINKFK